MFQEKSVDFLEKKIGYILILKMDQNVTYFYENFNTHSFLTKEV